MAHNLIKGIWGVIFYLCLPSYQEVSADFSPHLGEPGLFSQLGLLTSYFPRSKGLFACAVSGW